MSDQTINREERESGTRFAPKFDSAGLLTAAVLDARTNEVLVIAFMNNEAVALTRSTGEVHFWSRSRSRIWKKGESSGNILKVKHILVDCDQDALVIHADPAGPTCHTGARSCFYRELDPDAENTHALRPISD